MILIRTLLEKDARNDEDGGIQTQIHNEGVFSAYQAIQ